MRLLDRHFCFLALAALVTLLPLGCEDGADSENVIQAQLDTAILNLDSALAGTNTSALESVIASAKRLRPSLQSQIQTKNLIIATAKGKLAQLTFDAITPEANVITTEFQLAINQSNQIAILRMTANSASANTAPTSNSNAAKQVALQNMKEQFETQLQEATSAIETLRLQKFSALDLAHELRTRADILLDTAEEDGIIQGYKSYKAGAKLMRDSQRTDMTAAEFEFENQVMETPRLEDARAELEAIASKLAGLEQTAALLHQLHEDSTDSAAKLRLIADELDNETAELLNAAIEKASTIKEQWNTASSLIQEAIQSNGSSRGAPREAKAAMAIWKLDMELTLGSIEESKCQFLLEESLAIDSMIANGIVTSENTWRHIADTVSKELEHATINAIAAYENARQLSSSAGPKSDAISSLLEKRIALLNGEVIPEPVEDTSNTTSTGVSTFGFATPEDLIAAFNALPPLEGNDGTSQAPDLSIYFEGADAAGHKGLGIMQKIATSSANLAIAIRTHLGEEAIQKMTKAMPTPAGIGLKVNLDLKSLAMLDDDSATINDVSGKPMQLQKTTQGWKIFFGGNGSSDPQAAEFAMMILEGLGSMADVMDTVTGKINDGTLTSFEQVEQEIMNAASGDMGF
jgi:hypothetical protein